MSTAVKYTFDNHFDGPTPGPEKNDARARKPYSGEEIELLKREAREEGRKDGDVRATQAVAASLAQVAAAVHSAIRVMDAEVENIRSEAAALALAAAKKLAGAALASVPEAEIVAMLHLAFQQAVGEPRVIVRASPFVVGRIGERANAIAEQEGFDGRVQWLADETLRDTDCRIEWRDGGIELAHAAIETALANLVARRFPLARIEEKD